MSCELDLTRIFGEKITPQEYIRLANSLAFLEKTSTPTRKISLELPVVEGSVDLRGSIEGRSVRFLPPAVIRGYLRADGDCSLECVECVALDGMDLDGSPIREMRPSTTVYSHVSLCFCNSLESVKGHYLKSVDLGWSSIRKLGAEFSCSGNVDLEYCKKLEVVDCKIGGNLNLDASSISCFGEICIVSGSVDIRNCQNLRELTPIGKPRQVNVNAGGLRTVNSRFVCLGVLSLENCRWLESVNGHFCSIEIKNCQINTLKAVRCDSSVNIEQCQNLSKIEIWSARSISVSSCDLLSEIKILPAISGLVKIEKCPRLTRLEKIACGGLYLDSLKKFRKLGAGLKVKKDILITECPNLSRVTGQIGRNLHVTGKSSLETLDESVKIKGSLVLMYHPIGSETPPPRRIKVSCFIGNDVVVAGNIILETTELFKVARSVSIENCHGISGLRGEIGEDLRIEKSKICDLGADLEIGGSLRIEKSTGDFVVNCLVGKMCEVVSSEVKKIGPVSAYPNHPKIC